MSQKLKRSRRRGETTYGTEEEKPVIAMSAYEGISAWPPDRRSRKKGPKLKVLYACRPPSPVLETPDE
jgi:hypothetical protein